MSWSSSSSPTIFDSFGTPFNYQALFASSPLPSTVQHHLALVYAALAATIASSAIGAFSAANGIMRFDSMPQIPAFGAMLVGIALTMTRGQAKSMNLTRLGMLLTFGFLDGLALGPALQMIASIDPSIIVTALLATCTVFVSFTLTAVFAKRRSYLYLGSLLSSALFVFMLAKLFGLPGSFQLQLYGGLFVFCGFILFDTQLIIEQCLRGDLDVPSHALNLFVDFVAIFVRILVILTRNSESRNGRGRDEKKTKRR